MDGHDVRTVTSGPAALDAVRAEVPDVVLCDIAMPGMDGHAVAREVRALTGPGRVTLVAMTGHGLDEDRQRSRAAGFDHHFVKPIDPTEIEDLLRDVARANG
jgi:CheY-like chemotaxis protein